MTLKLPNFLIVGAGKSGTSTLKETLRNHPQIFMPRKEGNFFFREDNFKAGLEWYGNLFAEVKDEIAIGEKTPAYSNHTEFPHVPGRIYRLFPEMKLIWIFRNPVDRFVSHIWQSIKGRPINPWEPLDPKQMLQFLKRGLYAEQIKLYLKYFRREQMCFLLLDDMVTNPQRVHKIVYKFLGVDDSFVLKHKIHANNGQRNKGVAKSTPYPEISEELYLMMQKTYIASYEEFSDLTGLEIDSWYENQHIPVSKQPFYLLGRK